MTESEFKTEVVAELTGNWPYIANKMTPHEYASCWRTCRRFAVADVVRVLRAWKDTESRIPQQSDISARCDTVSATISGARQNGVDYITFNRNAWTRAGEQWVANATNDEVAIEYWQRVRNGALQSGSSGLAAHAETQIDGLRA